MNVLRERRQLLNVSYRLLGSLADSEDVVQEAYARWFALSTADQAAIVSPGAWLTTVTSRLCLNLLGSARVRRETYVGEWIPEPLPDVPGDDPADRVTLDESIGMAFLVVLESMTPAERVAFILHDVFGYPFDEIAQIVGRSSAASRQLASSARRRLRAAPAGPPAAQATLVREFKQAWDARDVAALIGLLDPSAIFVADGGGRAPTVLEPILGGENIARAQVEIARVAPGVELVERMVNGQPGLIAQVDGVTVTVFAFRVARDRITNIWAVRNPDKLRPWT
ncbi:RNA polymerase sigma factor SigJ [Cellulomonas sp. McL0617]|uniref:RNA polymerase sigma factor SigJ n=1 Tax=Cellulomonas sp. McL0617 TaxID=3415675 RepID=UPI003CF14DAC